MMSQENLMIGKYIPVEERRARLEALYNEWTRQTISTHFKHVCEKYSNSPYIFINDEQITYEEVWQQAEIYAKAMLHMGVKRRDHVAFFMENDLQYPSLFIATSMIGAVFIPLNTMLHKEDLGYILAQS